jgi:hypothetical protein
LSCERRNQTRLEQQNREAFVIMTLKLQLKERLCQVVVEVLGFGALWICRSMPTFPRNMLSPFSGAEVTRQGNRGII